MVRVSGCVLYGPFARVMVCVGQFWLDLVLVLTERGYWVG